MTANINERRTSNHTLICKFLTRSFAASHQFLLDMPTSDVKSVPAADGLDERNFSDFFYLRLTLERSGYRWIITTMCLIVDVDVNRMQIAGKIPRYISWI